MEMTLGEAFARSARKFPGKVACMDDEACLTYDQLNRRVNRWAHAIRGLGVGKGAHVATLMLFSLRRGVINHCRQHLASYKKPTSVVFVEELPKGTFGGKILKRVLREKYGKQ